MNTPPIQMRLASLHDVDQLLGSVLSEDELWSALLMLLGEPMCDFAIATNDTGRSLAYTQIRYFYSLWSLGLEAKVEDLFVSPQEQGQGLDSKLLEFTVECAHR